jgi:arylsulfatase A-like enzyme
MAKPISFSSCSRPNRRRIITAGAATGIAGIGAGWWLAQPPKLQQRNVPQLPAGKQGSKGLNILLVMTDQERFDLPAALPLPGHDRLRERGSSFTQHQVNTTPCSPSRSNLYFGQHTQHTRMTVNLGVYPEPQIPAAMPSLGHYLRANGYYTAYKGKWHLSELRAHYELTYGRYPSAVDALEPFGFSDFNFDGDPHGSTWTGFKFDGQIASEASTWLQTKGKALGAGKPWFLAVNFVNPHDVMYYASGEAQVKSRVHRDYLSPIFPAPVSKPYDKLWDLPLPANHKADLKTKPWAHANYNDFCNFAFGKVPATEEAWKAYQSYYFNCLRDVDSHLMTVLDALQASGQADNTIVIFTADHGEMAGAQGLRQKGPFMYQENVRVPFIVRHPDAKHGHQTAALSSAVDLVPTVLEMAGIPQQKLQELYPQLAGVSVAAAVAKPDAQTERTSRGALYNYNTLHYIDSEFVHKVAQSGIQADRFLPLRATLAIGQPLSKRSNPAFFRGIHTGSYKFARYFQPAQHHTPTDWETLAKHNQLELYDTQADPQELNNLASKADPATQALIMKLNTQLNALIAKEVGKDVGDEHPGPGFLKRL